MKPIRTCFVLFLLAIPLIAEIGTLDNVPAATLLLPYFEVDLQDLNGSTTVLTIGNATPSPTLAHLTLWTDRGIPTYSFDVYLGGFDLEQIDLRLLFSGVIPQTSPTLSPAGSLSAPHTVFPNCAALLAQGKLPDATVAALRNAHLGFASALFGGSCAAVAHGDSKARGYVTIDATRQCTTGFPTTSGYFVTGGAGIATNNNVLWGEYAVYERRNRFAYGDGLVPLEASATAPETDGVDGPVCLGFSCPPVAPVILPDYTFYRRKTGGTADHRESLPNSWMARYRTNGPFSAPGGTVAHVWRDTDPVAAFPCASPPAGLTLTTILPFDDQENPASFTTFSRPGVPYATQTFNLADPSEIAIPFPAGMIFYDLQRFSNAGPLERRNQAYVSHVLRSGGLFAGEMAAWPMGTNFDTRTDFAQAAACQDGLDNDNDGLTDFPNDPDCRRAFQGTESSECSDLVDNDGDGATDFPNDPQCYGPRDLIEFNNPQCDDGIDNDLDGLIDWPADPRCFNPTQITEAEGVCGDGIDNDGDGLTDFPSDPGCTSRNSGSESPACKDGIDNDGDGAIDFPNDPGCAGNGSTNEAPECQDGIDNDGDGLIDFPADPGCAALTSGNERPQCNDGIDNDSDGLIDLIDPGCGGSRSFTFEARASCGNGVDDDGDSQIDFPNEQACSSDRDNFEGPDCNDGTDNDGDGRVDLQDPGCASPFDQNELAGTTTRECSDGINNDGDGATDYPSDTGCTSRYDNNERVR